MRLHLGPSSSGYVANTYDGASTDENDHHETSYKTHDDPCKDERLRSPRRDERSSQASQVEQQWKFERQSTVFRDHREWG